MKDDLICHSMSIYIYYINNINGKYSNISDQDRKTKRLCVATYSFAII